MYRRTEEKTYGRAPNAIDICSVLLVTRLIRETAPFSRLLQHAWDTEDTFSTLSRECVPGEYATAEQTVKF